MFYPCLSFCPQGGIWQIPSLAENPPSRDPPGQRPPGPTPPGQTHSLDKHPLGRHPPTWADTRPPRQRPPSDGHCSGRYASYWNAFLFLNVTTEEKGELGCYIFGTRKAWTYPHTQGICIVFSLKMYLGS